MPPRHPLPPPRRPLPSRLPPVPEISALGDRYQVEGVLGRSRGLLLRASQGGLRQPVAIRVLAPALTNPRAVQQFVRETRLLAVLESEHTARIHDVGVLPSGAIYVVRDFVEGQSLGELTRTRLLPVADALELFLQVCEAVAEVHSFGVVLRDLRLGHAFISHRRNGEPRLTLTDFGTCKVLRQGGPAGPGDGEGSCTQIVGLSHAASPELLGGREIDRRGDIWSLGCILYELLTGRPPFVAAGAALLFAIARQEPLAPSALRPELPRELDRLLASALRKDPGERPRTVSALVRPLRALVSARGTVLIDQIARLAGEEPTAPLPRASVPPSAPSAEEAEAPLAMVRSLVPSSPGSQPQAPASPPQAAPASPPPRAPAPPPTEPSPPASSVLSPGTPVPSTWRTPRPWETSPRPARRVFPLVMGGGFGLALSAVMAILLVELNLAAPVAAVAHERMVWTMAAAVQHMAELCDVAARRVAAAHTPEEPARVASRTRPRRSSATLAAPVVVVPASTPEGADGAAPTTAAERVEPIRSPFLTPVEDLGVARDARRGRHGWSD